MKKVHQNIVKEIAQELDCGFNCYFNSNTDEIITIPNFSHFFDDEEFKETFRESIEKIEKQQSDFMKFEPLESFESFKIMERFIEQLADDDFKMELENVLTNKKPFQNFKHKIDQSEFRQSWFEFKQSALEKIVENQLNLENPDA
ncbi:UPF0158 family protein [Psychroserpens sp. NJDZ02]|uniref:UPF0158 family protein n=1 Tax=Psychroserpens sp. NJDZ02 TaxID=2570561 RepID=UPI0010A7ED8B|nr:UPF0158 family protein [Psychroserpens sp. NJDZ02]QCE40020.1 hypothetical protein E9099_00800 [Psychroserpens sp. NJDZ02]